MGHMLTPGGNGFYKTNFAMLQIHMRNCLFTILELQHCVSMRKCLDCAGIKFSQLKKKQTFPAGYFRNWLFKVISIKCTIQ